MDGGEETGMGTGDGERSIVLHSTCTYTYTQARSCSGCSSQRASGQARPGQLSSGQIQVPSPS